MFLSIIRNITDCNIDFVKHIFVLSLLLRTLKSGNTFFTKTLKNKTKVGAETIVNTQQQLTRLINIACHHQQSKTVQNTKKHTHSINTGWLISQDHAKNVVLECF